MTPVTSSQSKDVSAAFLASAAFGGVVIAAMSVGFAISFTALIYKGALSPFLGPAIVLSLVSVISLGLVGAAFFSYRGTICGPQDVTAILLGSAGAAVAVSMPSAPSQSLFQTVVVLVGIASLSSGVAAYVCGRMRLGYLARFVPYPVIGGFLAATGYLLTISALGMVVGEELTIWNLVSVLLGSSLIEWVPWTAGAVLIVILGRQGFGGFVLPGVLLLSVLVFFGVLFVAGIPVSEAQQAGLLLGPFEEFSLADVAQMAGSLDIHWGAIIAQIPTLIAVAGLTILGTLLNSTGLEMTLRSESDFEADLRAAGLANGASGLFGGLPGYQLIGETMLAANLGLKGRLAGICAAGGAAFTLTFGTQALSYVPVGVLTMLIASLGIDMLVSWLLDARKRLNGRDFGIILLILGVAAFVGFLQALAVGLLAAMVIFVFSYASHDVVRLRSTATTRRSRVERSDNDMDVLAEAGGRVIVLELRGYMFFGTANTLTGRVRAELDSTPAAERILIDFAWLTGFDASAAFELRKIVRLCDMRSVRCVFVGMSQELAVLYGRATPEEELAETAPSLEEALLTYEGEVLAGAAQGASSSPADDELFALARDALGSDATGAVSVIDLAAGEVLMREGACSQHIYLIENGALRAEVIGPTGGAIVVARFLPGAPVGEIAYYTGTPRTATITAEEASRVYKLDPALMELDAGGNLAQLHVAMASHLARRLMRTTQLIRDAGL